ncbi:DNA polymerase III subunit gamma/tau [Pacificimonas flava]|uniref:DNA polymerase III subunit gamma/tau n=2 Tax=Pacificimonas TaxID=1960290 RepID=A0A219B1I1_9SPHN|nr:MULTISPECIES: DNA polymerase III subunit gamma/tau [Pacificimonas]MBZ6378343.1 DNA polymerase III subunit gamma/tau [Pacificimonas aurantium]OWV32054.1 DNA polymerase III subunit gamma/tau [Pacificimonas flava]
MSDFSLESQEDGPVEDDAAAPADAPAQPYLVLARKYRPTRFSDLIGQDAMVKTLANAIEKDRIAHAFLMTGVRGVGKTSTARLIAKALNCIGPDGDGGPTIDPCGVCEPCRAITEGRFIDVVEMDAASHTGVDDMREIIDASRYAAVSARYKIYIIDEVHMLSKNAFNALLKTLEEPPAHVKFIMATTEVEKVPVTVLSRTQRFDLRRIPPELLFDHFKTIAATEGVDIEEAALKQIASAADGSVRDGLSLLDQAIAHGSGLVTAEAVRGMLGLADRARVRTLLGHILDGDAKAALDELNAQYVAGAAPDQTVEALLGQVHAITRMQLGADPDLTTGPEGRQKLSEWAEQVGPATLHRLWQLLLKGLEEVKRGTMPLETAEMAILRTIHAAQMPDPGALMKALDRASDSDAGPAPAADRAAPASVPTAMLSEDIAEREAGAAGPEGSETPARSPQIEGLPREFDQLLDFFVKADPRVEAWLHDEVGVVRYEGEDLVLSGREDRDLVGRMKTTLREQLGADLRIVFQDDPGAMSKKAREDARIAAERQRVMSDPNVKKLLDAFPDAELVGYELETENDGARDGEAPDDRQRTAL